MAKVAKIKKEKNLHRRFNVAEASKTLDTRQKVQEMCDRISGFIMVLVGTETAAIRDITASKCLRSSAVKMTEPCFKIAKRPFLASVLSAVLHSFACAPYIT